MSKVLTAAGTLIVTAGIFFQTSAPAFAEEACLQEASDPYEKVTKMSKATCETTLDNIANSCANRKQKKIKDDLLAQITNHVHSCDVSDPAKGVCDDVTNALRAFSKIVDPSERAILQKKMIEKAARYAADFNCVEGVKFIEEKFSFEKKIVSTTKAEDPDFFRFANYQNLSADPRMRSRYDLAASEKSSLADVHNQLTVAFGGSFEDTEKQEARLTVCRKPFIDNQRKTEYVELFEPCGRNLKALYADNSWEADLSTLEKSPEYQSMLACIQRQKNQGFEVENISITTFSSLLDNTGKAAEAFCKKGFIGLSKHRAYDMADNVLPLLFKGVPNIDQKISEAKKTADYGGTNLDKDGLKDGTRGVCPTEIVDGKERLKDGYEKGGSKRAELDENKGAFIHVHFKNKQKPIRTEQWFYSAHSGCSKVSFECIK